MEAVFRRRAAALTALRSISGISLLLLSGCLVGPRYHRPAVVVPPAFRDATVPVSPDIAAAQIGDLKWSEVFRDAELQTVIKEAILQNWDVRIAAQRVLEQEAQVGITRAKSLPSLNAGGAYNALGIPSGALGNNSSPQFNGGGLLASAAWNLDFWGIYRRQTEAERADLLATQWGQRATLSSVVINVASSYIQLETLDEQLEITKDTVESRQESLRIVSLREKVGAATMADVHQSEQLLFAAEAKRPGLERDAAEQENGISLLLGRNPGPIARRKAPALQEPPEDVAVGIPSQLLERRPDIQQAEAQMIEANARIGVARAQFFPQVSITGIGGTATSQFDRLFNSNTTFYYAVGSISQPIFNGGQLKNNLRSARAKNQEMIFAYQKAIASAFRDVSNALVSYRKARDNRMALEKEQTAAVESVRLAHFSYDNGRTSYLEVLTNETNLFSVQLDLISVQQQERLSLVQLYSALGGGWK